MGRVVHTLSRVLCLACWSLGLNMSLAIPGDAISYLLSRDVMLFYLLVPMQWLELLMVYYATPSPLKRGITRRSTVLWLGRVVFLLLLQAVGMCLRSLFLVTRQRATRCRPCWVMRW